jgi:hypothetical protein
MTERTEYWWVEWCEGMPPEPARIGFEYDVPATIEELGGYTQPLADRDVRLIERVLPAGRAAAAVEKLEEAFDIRDEGAWVTVRKAAELLQVERS